MRKKCVHANKPKRGPYPMPMRPRVDYRFKDDAAREKALLRHPWYRKKLAWDALRARMAAE
jgi:hypothetical protein